MKTAFSLLKRHAAKVVLSLALGAGFVWMLHRGGLPIVPGRAAFGRVAWWAVPAYGALVAVTFFLRIWRWTHLVRPLADVPTRKVLGVGLVGVAAILFAPLRLGEIVRPWMLSTRTAIPFAQAAGTVGAERVIDGFLLSLVLLAGLVGSTAIEPTPPHVALVRTSAWVALAVFTCAFAAMAAFYSFRAAARRLTHSVVAPISSRAATWVTTQVERVADGLRFLPSFRHAAPYFRDTLLYWSTNVLGMWMLLRGCGVPASLAEACVTMGVLGVGILLPAGPGFFGAFQASVYAALAMFFPQDVVVEAGAAYVFILYAAQLVFSLSAIPLGLWLAGPEATTENLAPAPPLRDGSWGMLRASIVRRALVAGLLGAGAALLLSGSASAKASFDSPYSLEQTFNTSLRFVRVDLGLKITEKDPQAAYVLFEYKSHETGDRVSAGAVEIVPAGDKVKVVVQLAQLPRYHEQVLADALAKKLRDEYGEPVKRPPPPPPPSDAGPDGPPS